MIRISENTNTQVFNLSLVNENRRQKISKASYFRWAKINNNHEIPFYFLRLRPFICCPGKSLTSYGFMRPWYNLGNGFLQNTVFSVKAYSLSVLCLPLIMIIVNTETEIWKFMGIAIITTFWNRALLCKKILLSTAFSRFSLYVLHYTLFQYFQ